MNWYIFVYQIQFNKTFILITSVPKTTLFQTLRSKMGSSKYHVFFKSKHFRLIDNWMEEMVITSHNLTITGSKIVSENHYISRFLTDKQMFNR